MAKYKDTSKNIAESNTTQKVLNGISYATGIGIGAYIVKDELEDKIYHQFKGDFSGDRSEKPGPVILTQEDKIKSDIAERRNLRSKQRWKVAREGIDMHGDPIKGPSGARALEEIESTFEKDVKNIFKKNHLHNHWDYWVALNKTNRVKVAERAFTNAGIALAVMLTVTNITNVNKLFKREQQREDQESQGRN